LRTFRYLVLNHPPNKKRIEPHLQFEQPDISTSKSKSNTKLVSRIKHRFQTTPILSPIVRQNPPSKEKKNIRISELPNPRPKRPSILQPCPHKPKDPSCQATSASTMHTPSSTPKPNALHPPNRNRSYQHKTRAAK
ncbi:hypothetical protein DL98DRAFT_609693, partial [Cadophora sp. DSE1049]